MSKTLNEQARKKRTVIVENGVNGAVRISIPGVPYPDQKNNLLNCEIPRVWLSDLKGKVRNRAAYSSGLCTDDSHTGGCYGLCHYADCPEPAEFWEHWNNDDGGEHCLPFCKWHAQDTCYRVGRAVLWALNYGVVEDLRFWDLDMLPKGLPRCDYRYWAIGEGESVWARCTNEATTKVRVTESEPEAKSTTQKRATLV